MVRSISKKNGIVDVVIYLVLGIITVSSMLPVINTLAVSFSDSAKAASGIVTVYPIGFNVNAYKEILQEKEFFNAFLVSVKRIILAAVFMFSITVLAAYPLSKNKKDFRLRNIYMWIFIFTMMFTPPLIPTFMTVRSLNLTGKIWALVLPGVVSQFLVILVMNFFRSLPKELDEVASIDGAGPWRKLFQIYLPLSLPILATTSLFIIVWHWNAFFDGLIYMNKTSQYPLQTYIQQLVVTIDPNRMFRADSDAAKLSALVAQKTLDAAKMVVTMLPILLIYPFLQRYFITGIMLGSVKE